MQISDSRILLQDAERLLGEIESIHKWAVNEDSIPPMLKLKIKQFLENIDSALGYEAFNIFSKYCTVPANKLEQHESKLYFPVRNNKDSYQKFIDKWYPGLKEEKPEIISLIEKYQPFPQQSQWLTRLKYLVNNNKHRNLSKQSKRLSGHIKHIENLNGVKLTNIKFNNAETILKIDGKVIDHTKQNPYIKQFEGNIETHLFFKEINRPVISTIKEIYTFGLKLINELETVM